METKKGWSFCIVTAPNNTIVLNQCINKIQSEFSDDNNYEIIIVGNLSNSKIENNKNVKILPFEEDIFSLKKGNIKRAWKEKSLKRLFFRAGAICHKKNLAAKNARYDKLCIMHDYVGIESGWKKGYELFGYNWEVCMNIILNKDGTRHRDWMCWDHPSILDGRTWGAAACLIPYDKYTKYMYISGTYFCVKKDFFLKNSLNEKLFWGDGEDVEWSLRVREKTIFKMNNCSIVKYLKLKPLDGAPYCKSWKENENKLMELFYDKKTF